MDGSEDDAVYADVCKAPSRDEPSDPAAAAAADTADDVSDDDCDEEDVYDDLIPDEVDLDRLFGGDEADSEFDGFWQNEQN